MALLEADVNYKVAKDFVESVRIEAEGQDVWQDLKPHEQVVKIVYDELVNLMGGTSSRLARRGRCPARRAPRGRRARPAPPRRRGRCRCSRR